VENQPFKLLITLEFSLVKSELRATAEKTEYFTDNVTETRQQNNMRSLIGLLLDLTLGDQFDMHILIILY